MIVVLYDVTVHVGSLCLIVLNAYIGCMFWPILIFISLFVVSITVLSYFIFKNKKMPQKIKLKEFIKRMLETLPRVGMPS